MPRATKDSRLPGLAPVGRRSARAGSWYCPEAVGLFERVYRSGKLDWILHHLNDEESMAELPPVVEVDPGVAERVLERGERAEHGE